MNYDAIKKAAEGYKADMVKFLRDMIAIPSESCEEEGVVKRIAAEMEKLIPSASATVKTGPPIPTKAMRRTISSTAAAAPTRKAAWLPRLTAPRS